MTHAHITTWLLTLILFLIALNLNKNGNAKGFKILHMITRLFYVLTIITGGMLFSSVYDIGLLYILKAVVGLWIISLFELILINSAKKKRTKVLWIQFVIAFLLVLYLGLKLPMGIHIF